MRHSSLWWLTACAPKPLAEVPISGAIEEVEQALREELAAFDAATGYGRTRISRVVIRDKMWKKRGQYNTVTHTIQLNGGLSTNEKVETLRHELCHSLNFHEMWHKDEPELYLRLADGLFSSDIVNPENDCKSTSCRQHEAFAVYCELGPWAAHALLGETCPTDEGELDDAKAILSRLAEHVWTDFEPIVPTIEQPQWASIEVEQPPPHVRSSAELEGIFFVLEVSDWIYRAPVDVRTGEEGDPEGWRTAHYPNERLPDDVPKGLFTFRDTYSMGSREGPHWLRFELELWDQGTVERQVFYDGERWRLIADGCPTPSQIPFFVAGQLFTFRVDGTTIGWGPVAP